MLGDDEKGGEYQFLPPASGRAGSGGSIEPAASIREEIEEQGVIGGLAGRIKRTADAYLKQKLDEIERRIDEKLDEIDKKLGEWRDKEVANRLRILKITMWAAVAVSILSLLYSYIKVYIIR
jgi:hypothetical protein